MLWLLALVGCKSDRPPPPTYECGGRVDCAVVHADDPVIEVGIGDEVLPFWAPLPEDAQLPLVEGPQGGYHVFLGVRAKGLCPTLVSEERHLRLGDDPLVHRMQRRQWHFVEGDDGWWTFPYATRQIVCPPTYSGYVMHGVPLEVDITIAEDDSCVTDGGAPRTASGTARFVAICPEGDDVCRTDDVVGCDVWEGG